ncbi:MAG TPA: glutamine--fructose-6-phosphate transaminase (isomerizing), partial [Rhodothermales bacterium]
MCGIVGYIGQRQVRDLLLTGLQRLEYRGYDSAGVAIIEDGQLVIRKQKGKVSELKSTLNGDALRGTLGVGHTRWATHGFPSDENAHPHVSNQGEFALVHNGIIENYAAIREKLKRKGYSFVSQTDTEALVHLIDDVWKSSNLPLEEAVRQALTQIVGTYGIVVVSASDPDLLIAARKGSPLILGVGEGEYVVASDAAAVVEHTRQVVYLNDGELVLVRREGFEVRSINNERLDKQIHELEWDLEEIEKSGFDHFMLKEIMEQPEALENAMRGRVRLEDNRIKLGGLIDVMDRIREADRILIVACGTSWHAGLVGEYLIEEFARIPVEVEYASEFRYRNPILRKNDVVIAISQSGETADTLAAVREAQKQGVLVIGICNVVGSTIARETDAGVYLHAGPEIGVASTKAFTAQVTVLTMLALKLAEGRTLSEAEMAQALQALAGVPEKVRKVLEQKDELERIAQMFRFASNFLYLGRGYNFPVALE